MHSLSKESEQPQGIIKLAVLYLMLPIILFLAGWVHVVWATSLILLILFSFVLLCRALPGYRCFDATLTPRQKWRRALFFACWSFGLVFLCGFDGTVLQAGDFLVRNPMYHELTIADWPLIHPPIYENNIPNYMVYSLGSELPPALLSKVLPINPNYIRLVWYGTGLFLFCMVLSTMLKNKKIFLFLILAPVVNGLYLNLSGGGDGIVPNAIAAKLFNAQFQMGAMYLGINHTFHLSIPAYLFIALLLSSSIPARYLPFTSSLLLISSPLSAMTLLPWISYVLFKNYAELRQLLLRFAPSLFLPTLAGVLILLVVAQFTSLSAGCRINFLWQLPDGINWTPWLCSIITMILIPSLLMKRGTWREYDIYLIMVLVTLGCYCLHIGTPGRNNELILKNAYYCTIVTTYYLISNYWSKWLLAIYFILSSYYVANDITCKIVSLTRPAAQNVNDRWGNHMFHPEDPVYICQFSTKKRTTYPSWLFYGKAGESAETLLRPFKTGKKSDDPSWYREILPLPMFSQP